MMHLIIKHSFTKPKNLPIQRQILGEFEIRENGIT